MARTEFTPRSIVSGRVPATSTKTYDAAFSAAAELLGTEHIALVHTQERSTVWYIACIAADLGSYPGGTTPLAAALPGAKGHEGDGAYITELANGLQAVIVKRGENLHSFVGTPPLVQRFIALEGATQTHPCVGPGKPWQLATEVTGRREARLLTGLTVSGVTVALIASAVWLWAAHNSTGHVARLDALRSQRAGEWATLARSLAPPAYPPPLAHLQKAVEQAIKEGGYLLQFEHQSGRSTWSINSNGRLINGKTP
jgi:hypothetical protein